MWLLDSPWKYLKTEIVYYIETVFFFQIMGADIEKIGSLKFSILQPYDLNMHGKTLKSRMCAYNCYSLKSGYIIII